MFHLLLAVVAVLAGAVASVVGFGIGSLLTPLLAVRTGTKLAIAAVSIPHFAATALRFWMLRQHVDRKVLLWFGLASAAGGLAGALLQSWASNLSLTAVFGAILCFAGLTGLTGLMDLVRFGRRSALVAGGASGFLGGMVGNQGGIRSAALLGFDVGKEAFVATATATGLIVDLARMPVYLATELPALESVWPFIALATAGTLLGTVLGKFALKGIPQGAFRKVVSGVVLLLGLAMLLKAVHAF